MGGVGAVGDVDGVDGARLLLGDALENPFGARALDADGNPLIFGFECLGQPFPDVQLQRGVVRELALLAGCFNQCGRHARRWRRRCPERLGEQRTGGKRGRGFEHAAPGPISISHGVSRGLCAIAGWRDELAGWRIADPAVYV